MSARWQYDASALAESAFSLIDRVIEAAIPGEYKCRGSTVAVGDETAASAVCSG